MAGPSWLVDSNRIATKIKSASDLSDPKRVTWKSNPSRACPNCQHVIDNTDVAQEWPGLPRGVKFDPSDQEIIWHLLTKVGVEHLEPHPFINEFIPTVKEEDGICYTHPQNLPGVKKDGTMSHFFHRAIKAYNTGTRKRRKIHGDNLGDVRWHKTGRTKPVMLDGAQRGCKKIMVLYMSLPRGGKAEKTNWVMHQYHLGTEEDEKDGEYVISKIFYQQQQMKLSDKTEQEYPETSNMTLKVDPVTPKSVTPDPPHTERRYSDFHMEQTPIATQTDFLVQHPQTGYIENEFQTECPQTGYIENEFQTVCPQTGYIENEFQTECPQTGYIENEFQTECPQTGYIENGFQTECPQTGYIENEFQTECENPSYGTNLHHPENQDNQMFDNNADQAVEDPKVMQTGYLQDEALPCENPSYGNLPEPEIRDSQILDNNDDHALEDPKWWDSESQYLLNSQQLVEGLSICEEFLRSQSPNRENITDEETMNSKPRLSDYARLGAESLKKDLEECQNLVLDPANIELGTPPEFRLSQLEFGSQDSFVAWGGGKVLH